LKSTFVVGAPKPNPYVAFYVRYILQIKQNFIDLGLEKVVEDL
jgi:hypothetical protein